MTTRPPAERREDLVALLREMREDHDCPLVASRTNLVFGAGNANADLMFVGEAPGRNEDEQGLPFVGRAGQLLDQLLGEIGLSRADVFITNTLKCRPPGNRDPLPSELEVCTPFLYRQIALIEPKVICTLGNFATKLLTERPDGITRCHGAPCVRELGGRPVRLFPVFHPAAALRTPSIVELMRADFAGLPALLEEPLPAPVGEVPEVEDGLEPTEHAEVEDGVESAGAAEVEDRVESAGPAPGPGEPPDPAGPTVEPAPPEREAAQLDLF